MNLFAALALMLVSGGAAAQFQFNFNSSGGSVVGSIANQSCGGAGGGGMMGGGRCDGTTFSQQVVTVGGQQYYHIVIGTGGSEFALEYYMRTSGLCWFGCANARVTGGMGGGGMGGMGGGPSPLSSSMGDAADDGAPLSNRNSGTGAPDRVAIRQINNTPEMAQEFLKATETRKPKITQALNVTDVRQNFLIDMSNSDYRSSATAGTTTLTQTINIPGLPDPGLNPSTGQILPDARSFDISKLGQGSVRDISGGRFTYTAGRGDGGSLGTYNYFADAFDVYNVNWVSYCVPSQNPASRCTNYPSVRGGMGGGMGGAGGGGGAMGGMATGGTTTGGTTTGGTTTGGAMGGGMSGMSAGATTALTPTTTTTTTSTGSSGTATTVRTATTTTIVGGAMGGGGAVFATTTSSSTILTTTSTTRRATTASSTTSTTTTTTLSGGSMGGRR